MRFSKRLPNDTATLLQVTVFIIVLLGLSLASHDPASHHVQAISIVGAICLLVVYMTWVVPYLRSDELPGARAAAARRAAGASETAGTATGGPRPTRAATVAAADVGAAGGGRRGVGVRV